MEHYNTQHNEYTNQVSMTTKSLDFQEPTLKYVSDYEELAPGSANAAGLDLYTYSIDLNNQIIGTGIYAAIPTGWVGLVVPRSSLGLKGFALKNTLGVIDSDYRGEIKLAYKGYTPAVGERVAQMVLVPHYTGSITRMNSIDDLDATERGEGGFGSTGV